MKLLTNAHMISYDEIIEALNKEEGTKAGRLLRSHVETILQRLKKWGMDSGFLHRDLKIASKVQQASLPQDLPVIPGLQCARFYKPAHSVGGDYYDFLSFEDGRWGIAIGDVSGKGMGAALVMATLQASLRAQILRPASNVETLMRNVNRLIRESSPAEFYASLFYAEYRPESRVLRYVNAGHNPPVVLRQFGDQCKLLTLHSGSVPVGALDNSSYRSKIFQLEPGDLLVAYTDGVTESEDFQGRAFGQERLKRMLCELNARDPQEILRHILNELSAHSAGCEQGDDITLLVLRVEAEEGMALAA